MKIKKLLSIILSACILICACAVPSIVSAEETAHTHEWSSECKTECGGECGVSPVIIVHGIMQSQVYVQDKEGNDIMTSDGFPIVEGMDMAFMFDGTGYNSTKFITSITIKNPKTTSYSTMFRDVATKNGSQITVNYTSETSELVDKMIATKSSNSNVVKGIQVD